MNLNQNWTCLNVFNVIYIYIHLKVPGPISQNVYFYSNDASPPKKSWFQISVKRFGYKKRLCILKLQIHFCVSLIMVTITSHIFINIFQTVQFPAVKFTRGNEKNTSFLLIPKSLKIWEKSEVIRPGSFKCKIFHKVSENSEAVVINHSLMSLYSEFLLFWRDFHSFRVKTTSKNFSPLHFRD